MNFLTTGTKISILDNRQTIVAEENIDCLPLAQSRFDIIGHTSLSSAPL